MVAEGVGVRAQRQRRLGLRHRIAAAPAPLSILSGAVITETVFSLDGMGLYFYNALLVNDPYPVMAWLMITAVMIVVFNLIADIAYGLLDPRVRLD